MTVGVRRAGVSRQDPQDERGCDSVGSGARAGPCVSLTHPPSGPLALLLETLFLSECSATEPVSQSHWGSGCCGKGVGESLLHPSGKLLEGSGRFWKVLKGPGRCWKVLGGAGRYWKVLEGAGRPWKVLEGSGMSWEAVEGAGRF